MIAALSYAVVILAGASMLWGLVTAVANRPPGKAQLLFAAFVELVVLVLMVVGLVRLATGFRPATYATTIGYLLGIVVLIPVAWFWANNERTRFSGVVMAVAGLGVLAMALRLMVLMPA